MRVNIIRRHVSFLAWFIISLSLTGVVKGSETQSLPRVETDLCDKASLQRGASFYVNYCAGCHSLQYARFNGVAKDIGVVDKQGQVLEKLVQKHLNFISDKVTDPIRVALSKKEGEAWFGVAPPDLSLITRVRGKDWVSAYLRSFYVDPSRPWGMNNMLFPEVGMPNVLQHLQGTQVATWKRITVLDEAGNEIEKNVIDKLTVIEPGSMTEAAFNQSIHDLVNFLDYVGEPHKLERKRLGIWVLLFLVIFALFAYLLKREYWKDVH